MTYREALERNESAAGLDFTEIPLDDLVQLIDDLPAWDYPLAEDCINEFARRAGINPAEYFAESDRDYNALWMSCAEALNIDF